MANKKPNMPFQNMEPFATYSLADVKTTIYHPDCGTCVLSSKGGGRVTISKAGDMASNTTTATGYVVVNKLVSKNGTISLEIPVNSVADKWLREWCKWLKQCETGNFALSTFTLYDSAAKLKFNAIGVVPQKEPDESYDQTSGNRQYTLLFAELTTQNS